MNFKLVMAMVGAGVLFTACPAVANAQTAPIKASPTFSVVVPGSESLDDAIVQLGFNHPELLPEIRDTLSAMEDMASKSGAAIDGFGSNAGGLARVVRLEGLLREEASQRGSGLQAAGISAEAPPEKPRPSLNFALGGNPHFFGEQALEAEVCSQNGCSWASTVFYDMQFDLGYTTVLSTSKIWYQTGSFGTWSLSADASCTMQTGPGRSCGYWSGLPTNKSWTQRTLGFNQVPNPAVMAVHFSGSWNGQAPFADYGNTPVINCDSGAQQCKFQ
jgi:hypothetical protein